MIGMSNTEEKTSIDKIVEYHPKFLEAIREVYPLAVLGSLCIAISAFTMNNYPDVQAYALSAASMFLIAFLSSLLYKLVKIDACVIIAYVSIGFATMFLFAVIVLFSRSVSLISTSFNVITSITNIFVYVTLLLIVSKDGKKAKNAKGKLFYLYSAIKKIGVPITILIIGILFVEFLLKLANASLPIYLSSAYLIFATIIWSMLIPSIIIDLKEFFKLTKELKIIKNRIAELEQEIEGKKANNSPTQSKK
jgi:hypothetical protein